MSGKKAKQARKSVSISPVKHRWETVAGLKFLTVWHHEKVIGVQSEADFRVQSFISLKRAASAAGESYLDNQRWVGKYRAFVKHFSEENASRNVASWNALPEEEHANAAVQVGLAFVSELSRRSSEGFQWNSAVEDIVDYRIQNFAMSDDGTEVLRVGDSR